VLRGESISLVAATAEQSPDAVAARVPTGTPRAVVVIVVNVEGVELERLATSGTPPALRLVHREGVFPRDAVPPVASMRPLMLTSPVAYPFGEVRIGGTLPAHAHT
jgi:hypothetical protein